MTFRASLIWGLVASLPCAMLPAAHGADGSAQTAAPAIYAPPVGGQLSSWKRSSEPTNVDIRFKKPEGIVFTDQLEQPANASAKATIIAPATAPSTASAAVPATTDTTATSAPASTSAQNAAASQTAQLQALMQPATPAATTAPETTAPAAPAGGSAAASPGGITLRDDQIQQVARLLMDQGVIRAAQEESLPPSPGTNGNNGMSTNGKANGSNGNGMGGMTGGECCNDGCNDCCCPPQPCLFWVGGVEATFLSPDLNSGGVSFAVEDITDDGTQYFSTDSLGTDSLYVAPRIWLGVQGCCWGANLRYWHMQATEGEYDPSIGAAGTWDDYDCGKPDVGYFTCSGLDAYTVDLELTRRFCIHNCWMQASIGVRHAELWANQSITGLAVTEAGLLNGYGRSDRNTRGTGLLLGLYGRKPLFPCSCVNWFYNARWSALWGPTQTSTETFAAVQASDPDFVATAASVNGAYTTIDDTLFIGEIQLGLEWNYCLCCLPANAFFRVAIEYQRWDGGNGFSGSDSFAGVEIVQQVDPTSIVSTTAVADSPQMDLLGFTIGTGLTW